MVQGSRQKGNRAGHQAAANSNKQQATAVTTTTTTTTTTAVAIVSDSTPDRLSILRARLSSLCASQFARAKMRIGELPRTSRGQKSGISSMSEKPREPPEQLNSFPRVIMSHDQNLVLFA
jgi:hypothetical protein